ncbi:nitrogen regulation protein NR(II) [Mangrovimicrobium sediminis]|uniref:nitrogen regulation protein NR(II) n=1 Tax=Mangrovimicrobium sediminis TaxID=2562682 RepID=UPI003EBA4639
MKPQLHENAAPMHYSQDILDNISTAVVALDAELQVLSVNNAGEVLLETSEARCVGHGAEKLVTQPETLMDVLEQVRDSRNSVARRSMQLFLHTGREICADLLLTPINGGDSGVDLLLEILPVDRLLKISREESIYHSQETTREMIRGLAHEIKNPLGGVRGAAQLLARELPNEELAEYTNIIIREADRLRDLVDRMLGPNQQPDRRDLNVHEVLEHVRNLIAAETDNRITVNRDYDPSLPDLRGDRSQLIQAVLNIVRNALQAAPDVDRCEITLRSRPQRQFTIGAVRHRLVCRLDIEDNGPGIPEDMLPTIFMPMVTGRAEGSGLGLTIAQSIITRHGGLLGCTSEPGRTCFTIYLPMEAHNA